MSQYTVGPGRTIEYGGVPLFEMSRYQLDNNGRYALRPWEADNLVKLIVELLNAKENSK